MCRELCILILFVALGAAETAYGAPVVTASQPTSLGNGWFAWTIAVDAADAQNAGLAVAVTITGTISQVALTDAAAIVANGGVNVDLSSRINSAISLDSGYAGQSSFDSVFDNSILSVALPPYFGATGGGVGSGAFQFSAGTPVGTAVLTAPLARIVGRPGIAITGTIARRGVDYPVEAVVLAPPVPTTSWMGLLLLIISSFAVLLKNAAYADPADGSSYGSL